MTEEKPRINPIVAERDDMIGRSSTSASSGKKGSSGGDGKRPGGGSSNGSSNGSGGGNILVFIILVALIGAGGFGWMQFTALSAKHSDLQQRFESLRDTLGLESTPERLECFDISHSSGEAVVASCVVFDNNSGALKSDYRRFNIDNITAGDDYAAMEQAIRRRYTRLMKGEGKLPDILLIDGGKGQIGVAKSVLSDLGVVGVMTIGVAKGTTRKPGMETLILADQNNKVVARPQQPALHLIQQIRDEAHRFAITGHKARRDKKRRISSLEGIPGVGATRRRDLLKHFGGVGEVKKASVADLMKVDNINKKVAEAIYGALYND